MKTKSILGLWVLVIIILLLLICTESYGQQPYANCKVTIRKDGVTDWQIDYHNFKVTSDLTFVMDSCFKVKNFKNLKTNDNYIHYNDVRKNAGQNRLYFFPKMNVVDDEEIALRFFTKRSELCGILTKKIDLSPVSHEQILGMLPSVYTKENVQLVKHIKYYITIINENETWGEESMLAGIDFDHDNKHMRFLVLNRF